MRFDRANVESGGPYHLAVANCERPPVQCQPSSREVLGEVRLLQAGARYGPPKRIRVGGLERVRDFAASVFDFIPDPVGVDIGVIEMGAVQMVGKNDRFVSEIVRQLSVSACCGVALVATPSPVAASVAKKSLLDDEVIIIERDRGAGKVIDFVQCVWGRIEADSADGRCKSKISFVRPKVAHE